MVYVFRQTLLFIYAVVKAAVRKHSIERDVWW